MSPDEYADLRASLSRLDPYQASRILGTVVRRIEPELRLHAIHGVLLEVIHTGAGNDTFRLTQVRNDVDLRLQMLERVHA